jgi:hypothetical protein
VEADRTWHVSLETDRDPILPCRVLNTLRRKGALVRRLVLEDHGESFSMSVLMGLPGTGPSHLSALLHTMPGVRVKESGEWPSSQGV